VKTYEGMFILEPTIAAKEWDKAVGEIEKILKKYNATIISINRWGERKLAYPIKKKNRGTYVLTYFQLEPEAVSKIYSDCQFSEIIMRILILLHKGKVEKVNAPDGFETPSENEKLPLPNLTS